LCTVGTHHGPSWKPTDREAQFLSMVAGWVLSKCEEERHFGWQIGQMHGKWVGERLHPERLAR